MNEKTTNIIRLLTFTTTYMAEEDRIAIDAKAHSDGTVRLLLTRRLLKRLLPLLYQKLLENYSSSQKELADEAAPDQNSQANSSNKTASEPVQLIEDSLILLATKASYKLTDKHIMVQFGNQETTFEIAFTPENLNSWFQIIQRHCVTAEWPIEEFISVGNSNQAMPVTSSVGKNLH